MNNNRLNFFSIVKQKLLFDKSFTIVPNPILYSFDKFHHYQSFLSGGHQLIIHGENLHTIQNIRFRIQTFNIRLTFSS